jgi:hypothetical protein
MRFGRSAAPSTHGNTSEHMDDRGCVGARPKMF